MAETIRESLYDADGVASFAQLKVLLSEGLLIPADEVQARIDSAVSEAVREERERCCRAICKRCATGDVPSPTQAGVWVHQYALGVSDGMQDCDAVELRKEPDHD